jgi:hypothetical protein
VSRLRRVQTPDREINQLQSNVAEILEPLSSNALSSGYVLSSVVLAVGDNAVNHKLNRTLIGWFIVRKRGTSVIYDKQDANTQKNVTLVLNSSLAETVDIYVF